VLDTVTAAELLIFRIGLRALRLHANLTPSTAIDVSKYWVIIEIAGLGLVNDICEVSVG
jgi:hypothetical protein